MALADHPAEKVLGPVAELLLDDASPSPLLWLKGRCALVADDDEHDLVHFVLRMWTISPSFTT